MHFAKRGVLNRKPRSEPGVLSDAEVRRCTRHLALADVGRHGQERLRSARVRSPDGGILAWHRHPAAPRSADGVPGVLEGGAR
jgi:hypothetical protein